MAGVGMAKASASSNASRSVTAAGGGGEIVTINTGGIWRNNGIALLNAYQQRNNAANILNIET